jgi:hypothetical protein
MILKKLLFNKIIKNLIVIKLKFNKILKMLPIKMNLIINFPMILYYKIKYKMKITNNNFNKKIN